MSFHVIHAKKRSQWITLFQIASQWSTPQAYWMTLALISNIANYLKYTYFWDCDGIDNVTLRLWKFSGFCSRHIVGVAGDDIMFHILVWYLPSGDSDCALTLYVTKYSSKAVSVRNLWHNSTHVVPTWEMFHDLNIPVCYHQSELVILPKPLIDYEECLICLTTE